MSAREKLETDSAKWNKANSLRQFIVAVEISLKNENCSAEEIAEKQNWLAWARNYADLIDPLTKGNSTVVEETEGMYLGSW